MGNRPAKPGNRPAKLLFVQAFEGSTPPDEAAPLTIKRCKILGLESRHGRKFTEAALKDAYDRKIYEGLTIYKDHPDVDYDDPDWSRKALPPRSVDDVLGSVANVIYVEGQGLFGDAVFTVDSELTRSVCLSARTNPRQYGFSHHAAYDIARYEGAIEIVGGIPHAFSVDLVTRPATTNGLFEGDVMAGKSTDASKDTSKQASEPPAPVTPTARTVLESVCKVGIALKVVQALEGDFMNAPLAGMAEGASVDDQITAAFRAAGMAIFDDNGMDDKAKLSKLQELFAAKAKLAGTDAGEGGDGDGAPGGSDGGAVAKEGDDAPAGDDKDDKSKNASDDGDEKGEKKDKGKPTTEAIGTPIGHLEALALLEKHKLPISKPAVESYALLPLSVAESQAVREVASQKEISDLKTRLDAATGGTPRSLPRASLEGGAGAEILPASKRKELADKPWLQFSNN